MAKRVIQLYDKYKSTTKVYPKVVEESFEPSAKEYIKGQVVANPTPAGGETTLAYLEIGGTKYAIPVPTNVVANPELAGTEAELGSIQIGETKYKIGGGKQLYQHNITGKEKTTANFKGRVGFTIINSSPTEMLLSDIIDYLTTNYPVSDTSSYKDATVVFYYTNALRVGSGIKATLDGGNYMILANGVDASGNNWGGSAIGLFSDLNWKDKVETL